MKLRRFISWGRAFDRCNFSSRCVACLFYKLKCILTHEIIILHWREILRRGGDLSHAPELLPSSSKGTALPYRRCGTPGGKCDLWVKQGSKGFSSWEESDAHDNLSVTPQLVLQNIQTGLTNTVPVHPDFHCISLSWKLKKFEFICCQALLQIKPFFFSPWIGISLICAFLLGWNQSSRSDLNDRFTPLKVCINGHSWDVFLIGFKALCVPICPG